MADEYKKTSDVGGAPIQEDKQKRLRLYPDFALLICLRALADFIKPCVILVENA